MRGKALRIRRVISLTEGAFFSQAPPLFDAGCAGDTSLLDAVMAKGEKEMVEKISEFAFLVHGQVGLDVGCKVRE
jgi:hypothetical protein